MASFKTAYLQKEEYYDLDVVGTSSLKVGDCVKLTEATSSVGAYIKKSSLSEATHIIAQSDMTLEYGHVPIEYRDYKYSDAVACTTESNPTSTNGTSPKHVALFKIWDKSDIVLDADGGDVSS